MPYPLFCVSRYGLELEASQASPAQPLTLLVLAQWTHRL